MLRRIYMVSGLMMASALLPGQMVPDAPVMDFKLPMFDDVSGYKIWQLEGQEGRYVSPERIDVIGMRLQIFSGDEKLEVQTTIESSEATMLIKENKAQGAADIAITGPNFTIEGKDWTWDGNTQTVIVRKDAGVAFNQKLTDILK